MDSVTQVLLGSAVACAIAPKRYRKRALLTGAVLGTLPDLDVLIHYENAIDSFIKHRSFSHSLIVLPIFSLFLLPLLRWCYRSMSWGHLYALVALSLITHPLLDALTSYGTQLFWPLSTPVYTASIFIVDPLYSSWLLLGLLAYLISPNARWLNTVGLVISTLYLGLGLGVQHFAKQQLVKAFPDTQQQDWFVGALTASPMCWHGVYVTQQGHYIETAFNITNPKKMVIEKYPILTSAKASNDWQKLQWFNPNTVTRQKDKQIISSDLRMGEFGRYVFEFVLAPEDKSGVEISRFSNQWHPLDQNIEAKSYHLRNQGNNYAKLKWSQFFRCLKGET